MKIKLTSRDRMSNTRFHAAGQPNWWARVGAGDKARFLQIPKVRGDSKLDVEVEAAPGDVIVFGVGPNNRHGIRDSYTVRAEDAIGAPAPAESENA